MEEKFVLTKQEWDEFEELKTNQVLEIEDLRQIVDVLNGEKDNKVVGLSNKLTELQETLEKERKEKGAHLEIVEDKVKELDQVKKSKALVEDEKAEITILVEK